MGRVVVRVAVGILAFFAAGAPLRAQTPTTPSQPTTEAQLTGGGGPIEVEGYAAFTWIDQTTASRSGEGGFGARIMFRPHRMISAGMLSPGFARHLSLGAFGTSTPARHNGVQTLFVGGELDWELLSVPAVAGTSPFFSLGAGGWRTSTSATANLPSTTKFALAPGAGTYVGLTPTIVLRGDLRVPIVFASTTRTMFEAAFGVGVRF